MQSVSDTVMRKNARRLIPFLAVLYVVAFLDRVNVSFAALTMNDELGISAAAYGLGASIFFVGYLLFEVPSNLALNRFGARLWIARIMVTWGLVSMATGFIHNATQLYVVRFFLGVAEAGFFPAVIIYLSFWFTKAYRARVTGLFLLGIPTASIVGAPLSTWLMSAADGWFGHSGWRWMFVLEGAPAVLLGIACLWVLVDRPKSASWLTTEEQKWLEDELQKEREEAETVRTFSLRDAFTNSRVLLLASVLFMWNATNYGITLWLPQIVKTFTTSTVTIGWIVAAVWIAAAATMLYWAFRADRFKAPTIPLILALILGSIGMACAAMLLSYPIISMIALAISLMGVFAAIPIFWTLPSAMLTGTAAAAGIAMINSVSQLAGVASPWMIGRLHESTGGFAAPMLVLAGLLLVAVALVVVFQKIIRGDHNRAREHNSPDHVCQDRDVAQSQPHGVKGSD